MPKLGAASAASSPTVTSASPGGLYGKYKQATEFFLDWLLRAHRVGVGVTASSARATASTTNTSKKKKKSKSKTTQRVALDVYHDIVTAIAREPSVLPLSLQKLWPRALAACETAITLRARVSLFFPPPTDEEKDTHAHFLGRLRSWLTVLQQAVRPAVATASSAQDKEESSLDFANYYAVLELPDDYFPESTGQEEDFISPKATTSRYTVSAAERKRLFDETFENDLNVELSFLFMELEELSEAVYDVFLDVKLQEKTLVEATVVAKIAIDCAASVIAKLQLKYPSIQTSRDMITMITDRTPPDQLDDLLDNVEKAWMPSSTPNQPPRRQYVAGTIIVDMLWVSRALDSFRSVIPDVPDVPTNMNLAIPDGLFGDKYNEEYTPHYCTPAVHAAPSFLTQQLPLLFAAVVANRAPDKNLLMGWFMDFARRFFKTRTATIHFIFVCICWIRSVAALQGDGGLGRNVSLSVTHRWDLIERLSATATKSKSKPLDGSLDKKIDLAVGTMQVLDSGICLVRANPILAGCILLDSQFQALHIGTETLLLSTRFRAFGHLYNALRDRQLLDTIPFVDEMLQVYDAQVFTPSRNAAVHGSYTRSYLVSSNATDASVDAVLGRRPHPPERYATRTRPFYHFPELSRVFRLLHRKDFSVLPPGSATTASWKTLLGAVSNVCSEELFGSRVLSRDMLKVSNEITGIFNTLCDTLGRRDDANRMLARGVPGMSRSVAINCVLEDAVVMPLLPFLDCLNRDGSISTTENAIDLLHLDSSKAMLCRLGGNNAIEEYCRRAADVISKHFCQRGNVAIGTAYYTFPPRPEWVTIEFGDSSFRSASKRSDTRAKFVELLEMMERSDGPLRGEELERLKKVIISDPSVLAMRADSETTELCTLLHHAAAGRVHDERLLEWLIQMGALHHQSAHCRDAPTRGRKLASPDENGENRPFNALAVHSAAKVGGVATVRMLLEAEQLRDINTVTYHTRESLAHLAVKHGHRKLYNVLEALGADVRFKDASGKYVYDLTSDAVWKRDIVGAAIARRRREEALRGQKSQEHQTLQKNLDAAAQLRTSLKQQRDQERTKHERPPVQKASKGVTRRGDSIVQSTGPTRAASAALKPTIDSPIESSTTSASACGENTSTAATKKKKNKKKKKKTTMTSVDPDTFVNRWQVLPSGRGNEDESSESDTENNSAEQMPTEGRVELLRRVLDVAKDDGRTFSSEQREVAAALALKIVLENMTAASFLTTPDARHKLAPSIHKRLAMEGFQVVLLLNEYQQQVLEPPLCSRRELWGISQVDKTKSTPLEILQKPAGTPIDFVGLVTFTLHTARSLADSWHLPQAKELLSLIERRLLTMKQRPVGFRKCVERYVDARRECGLEPAEGSTREAQRVFEWYADNHAGVASKATLLRIDRLHGSKLFMKIASAEPIDSAANRRFSDLLERCDTSDKHPELGSVVVVDGKIVAGCDTQDGAKHVFKLVAELATQCGLVLNVKEVPTRTMPLVGFTFSTTEIVRESAVGY